MITPDPVSPGEISDAVSQGHKSYLLKLLAAGGLCVVISALVLLTGLFARREVGQLRGGGPGQHPPAVTSVSHSTARPTTTAPPVATTTPAPVATTTAAPVTTPAPVTTAATVTLTSTQIESRILTASATTTLTSARTETLTVATFTYTAKSVASVTETTTTTNVVTVTKDSTITQSPIP